MKKTRFPIALRLFLFVSIAMLSITTIGLISQHYNMQKNFARYIADIEMQKLDQLIHNLQNVYSQYGDWGDAIQEQIYLVEGQADPNDYDQLSRWWLRRQYDIAFQQQLFKEKTAQIVSTEVSDLKEKSKQTLGKTLDTEQLQRWQEKLASENDPFEGITFPLKEDKKWMQVLDPESVKPLQKNINLFEPLDFTDALQTLDLKNEQEKPFISIPDRLGLSSRLSLYDKNKQFIVGDSFSVDKISYREMYDTQGQVIGYLGLQASLREIDANSINFFKNQKKYLLSIYVVSIILSLIVALLLATYFKKPIQRLLGAAQELILGNYQHQMRINRNDELGDLSQTVNTLAEILDQHEKSRKQWVADTSHELKTPLAVLQAQIEAMQDGIRKPTTENFDAMQRQVQSLKKLTQDLADLAQADVKQLKCYPSEYAVWTTVLQEVEHFQLQFIQAELQVQVEGTDAILWVDIDRFKQIIINLLQNTLRYTLVGGQIHIHSHIEQNHWLLYIDDSPLGVSDEQLQQLGQRFYRVDDSRTRSTGGSGLGLALSCQIAQILGGSLTFEHSPLGGLRCKLSFPIYKDDIKV